MRIDLGPCKLIWHYKNKKMVIEFIADVTRLIFDVDEKSCDMRLVCKIYNPNYAKEITKRLIMQLSKDKKPRSLLLIPNFGFASKKDSMEFHRALPMVGSAIDDDIQKIIFLILPTDDKSGRTRQVSKKI